MSDIYKNLTMLQKIAAKRKKEKEKEPELKPDKNEDIRLDEPGEDEDIQLDEPSEDEDIQLDDPQLKPDETDETLLDDPQLKPDETDEPLLEEDKPGEPTPAVDEAAHMIQKRLRHETGSGPVSPYDEGRFNRPKPLGTTNLPLTQPTGDEFADLADKVKKNMDIVFGEGAGEAIKTGLDVDTSMPGETSSQRMERNKYTAERIRVFVGMFLQYKQGKLQEEKFEPLYHGMDVDEFYEAVKYLPLPKGTKIVEEYKEFNTPAKLLYKYIYTMASDAGPLTKKTIAGEKAYELIKKCLEDILAETKKVIDEKLSADASYFSGLIKEMQEEGGIPYAGGLPGEQPEDQFNLDFYRLFGTRGLINTVAIIKSSGNYIDEVIKHSLYRQHKQFFVDENMQDSKSGQREPGQMPDGEKTPAQKVSELSPKEIKERIRRACMDESADTMGADDESGMVLNALYLMNPKGVETWKNRGIEVKMNMDTRRLAIFTNMLDEENYNRFLKAEDPFDGKGVVEAISRRAGDDVKKLFMIAGSFKMGSDGTIERLMEPRGLAQEKGMKVPWMSGVFARFSAKRIEEKLDEKRKNKDTSKKTPKTKKESPAPSEPSELLEELKKHVGRMPSGPNQSMLEHALAKIEGNPDSMFLLSNIAVQLPDDKDRIPSLLRYVLKLASKV